MAATTRWVIDTAYTAATFAACDLNSLALGQNLQVALNATASLTLKYRTFNTSLNA